MIDSQMLLPPPKEYLYIPPQSVNLCDLRGVEVGLKDTAYKRPLTNLPVRKKYLPGNTMIQIKPQVNLGLLGSVTVVGPVFGETRIDQ